jgi:hypothetical protein
MVAVIVADRSGPFKAAGLVGSSPARICPAATILIARRRPAAAPSRKPAPQRSSPRGTARASRTGVRRPHYLVIVKRGETRLFEELQGSLDRWPEGTAIVWDRRERDRRAESREVDLDRRRRQRRAEPDAMWYTHGFIVVETSQPSEESSRAASIG